MTIVSLNIQDGTTRKRRFFRRKRFVIPVITVILILVIIAIYILTRARPKTPDVKDDTVLSPPDPERFPPPSKSQLRKFRRGSVSSDSAVCSDIGRDVLGKNGTAVDSAIATMICNGLVTMQSMGIGGGFFMTIYLKKNETAVALDAREVAPLDAKEGMFSDEKKSKFGALAVGVPGELKGYLEAHRKYGGLSWEELVNPTIELCWKGFNISKHQLNALKGKKEVANDEVLNELFFVNGTLKKEGDLVVHEKYCETLKIIRDDPDSFYNGSLADDLVKDIAQMGGIIKKQDLLDYQIRWSEAISVDLGDDRLFSMPPPGSGGILALILNVLKGYNFTSDSIKNTESTVSTYHRIIEAFKFSMAKKTFLGDPGFVNVTEIVGELTSDNIAEDIRKKIIDGETFSDPVHYGASSEGKDDHGTAHISVLAPNGDAVSVTSTVNLYFGAAVTSKSTGIVLNSVMDDFSVGGFKNYFGLPFAAANKIVPGKRPLSSMSPTVIVDRKGDVRMVVGAAGGTKIPTGVALVVMYDLWFGKSLKEAIDAPRIHHQIFPMSVSYDYGIPTDIVKGLEKIGHDMKRAKVSGSVVNGISRENDAIFSNADYRKGGDASGL